MAEVLASLFEDTMNHDPKNPEWPERDRLVLSKGHSALGLYAALCAAGYIEEEKLNTFAVEDGALMNHPDRSVIPGVELSTGSLGHGISMAAGIALAGKKKNEEYFTYCIVGDAELQEGVVWETAMFSAANQLRRFVVIIDNNKIGNDGPIANTVSPEPLADKWRSFGFTTVEVDGHDRSAITKALQGFTAGANGPYALIAKTQKGKGLREGLAGTGKAHYVKGTAAEVAAQFAI